MNRQHEAVEENIIRAIGATRTKRVTDHRLGTPLSWLDLDHEVKCQIWSLYIVRCGSGALYTGITTNVEDRVTKHNSGIGAKSVIALGLPVRLVFSKKMGSYSEALKEEKRIKRLSKKEKEKLIL